MLRGLRLAKEAADKEAAEAAASVKVTTKTKKTATRMPQVHRY